MKIVKLSRTEIAFRLGRIDQRNGEWRDVPAYLEGDYLAGRQEAQEQQDRRAKTHQAKWLVEHGFVFV